jgi:hypothetical protein
MASVNALAAAPTAGQQQQGRPAGAAATGTGTAHQSRSSFATAACTAGEDARSGCACRSRWKPCCSRACVSTCAGAAVARCSSMALWSTRAGAARFAGVAPCATSLETHPRLRVRFGDVGKAQVLQQPPRRRALACLPGCSIAAASRRRVQPPQRLGPQRRAELHAGQPGGQQREALLLLGALLLQQREVAGGLHRQVAGAGALQALAAAEEVAAGVAQHLQVRGRQHLEAVVADLRRCQGRGARRPAGCQWSAQDGADAAGGRACAPVLGWSGWGSTGRATPCARPGRTGWAWWRTGPCRRRGPARAWHAGWRRGLGAGWHAPLPQREERIVGETCVCCPRPRSGINHVRGQKRPRTPGGPPAQLTAVHRGARCCRCSRTRGGP